VVVQLIFHVAAEQYPVLMRERGVQYPSSLISGHWCFARIKVTPLANQALNAGSTFPQTPHSLLQPRRSGLAAFGYKQSQSAMLDYTSSPVKHHHLHFTGKKS